MAHFGQLLRRLRIGRSQKAVAFELIMPQTTLSTLENQATIPRGEVLKKLCDFYGIDEAYFFPNESKEGLRAARSWLESLRHASSSGNQKIAAHSAIPLSDEEERSLRQEIKKHATTSDE